MKIAIGADHAAFAEKAAVREHLKAAGHEVHDLGTDTEASCDYPDFAYLVARAVANGEAERGLLVCGTGVGMAMTANKVPGVRAAVCESAQTVEMTRRHNDANVLCLGARVLPLEQITALTDLFLATDFEGGRHARRVGKIGVVEEGGDPTKWTGEG